MAREGLMVCFVPRNSQGMSTKHREPSFFDPQLSGQENYQIQLRLHLANKRRDFIIAVIQFALALLLVASFFWLQASQEAATFNRLTTGPKVTTWDALWVHLRVEAQ